MRVLLFLVAMGCANPPARPPAKPAVPTTGVQPLVIGETFSSTSTMLGERRVINVYLPPGYATGAARYPVLYMPDGGIDEDFQHVTGVIDVSIKNAVIRPMIVVGIENTERRRDLVGPTDARRGARRSRRAPAAPIGSAQFLRDELKPHVAAHYRVTAESAIVGESFAGLFVIETLLVEPTLFDAYIAVDPSVWWNRAGAGARRRRAPRRVVGAARASCTSRPPTSPRSRRA